MFIKRDISNKISELLLHFPVVIITGARQTGKTTLLKNMFPNFEYISLDLPSEAEAAEKNPAEFFNQHKSPLIIDEVQYAPEVFRYIKYLVDNQADSNGLFILSGSQSFSLMNYVSDSLAGRAAILNLENLSFSEIQQFNPNIEDVLIKGGSPRLWNDQKFPFTDYYHDYLATYIERDVRQVINVTNLRNFERFIRLCALRNAQVVNKNDLARDVGVSANTINEWLSVLQASNQIMLLEPYFENMGNRIIKSPKIYFADSGFLAYLLNINHRNIFSSPMLGMLWECYVFSELRKYLDLLSPNSNIYFYRDRIGIEVDFVIINSSEVYLLECKWTELPDHQDCNNIKRVKKYFSNKKPFPFNVTQEAVVCRTRNTYPISETCFAINGFNLKDSLNKFLS